MEPYVIELPLTCTGLDDEPWRIEFWTAAGQHWVNDVPKSSAESFYRAWKTGSTARAKFCKLCPATDSSDCTHDERPEQRGWLFSEMTKVRVMPMREAV